MGPPLCIPPPECTRAITARARAYCWWRLAKCRNKAREFICSTSIHPSDQVSRLCRCRHLLPSMPPRSTANSTKPTPTATTGSLSMLLPRLRIGKRCRTASIAPSRASPCGADTLVRQMPAFHREQRKDSHPPVVRLSKDVTVSFGSQRLCNSLLSINASFSHFFCPTLRTQRYLPSSRISTFVPARSPAFLGSVGNLELQTYCIRLYWIWTCTRGGSPVIRSNGPTDLMVGCA